MTVWGFDVHPTYQPDINFADAAQGGYQFGLVKASQGRSYVPAGLHAYFARLADKIEVPGFYHFLSGDGGSGWEQANHFVDVVSNNGGADGRLLAVDFENYAGGDPSNAQLKGFVRRVKYLTGHPVIIYSMTGFWNGGDSSGPFGDYNADAAWEARVWSATEQRNLPARFYNHQYLPWYLEQQPRGIGGRDPEFLQFTWGGLCGGVYCDVDAFRGSMDELKKLTRS